MDITVLGCSGGYASATAATSGYLVRAEGTNVWLDCGSGTLRELQRHVAPVDLSGVVLSHRHADHCVDLVGMYVHLKYDTERRRLPVLSPPDTRRLLEAFTSEFDDTLAWDVVDDGDTRTIGAVTLRFSRTQHPVPTLAVELAAGGKRMIYTSDTGPEWSFTSFAPGADLILAEATYNSQESGAAHHLTAAEAGASARAARARALAITHLWPTLDASQSQAEAREAFGAEVVMVRPGLTLAV